MRNRTDGAANLRPEEEETQEPVKDAGQQLIQDRIENLRENTDFVFTLFENLVGYAIIAADFDGNILAYNEGARQIYGYAPEEVIGKRNIDILFPREFIKGGKLQQIIDGLISEEGFSYEGEKVRRDGRRFPARIVFTPTKDRSGKVVGFIKIVEDLTERKRAEERLERSFVDLAETISRAEAYRDPYSSSHQRRVAQLVRAVGEKMGLDRDRLLGLEIGGLLHDIGKVAVPESILNKPGKLTQEEWPLVRVHARRGYEIFQGSNLPWPVAEMALHHHERLDGSGYPDGISGDELSLDLRILAACNVAEAMSAHRPHRPARSRAEIVEELRDGRGTKYDARVVDILLKMVEAGALEADSLQT